MTVYGDVLVIVNLYIDFFLLWCVKKLLHLRVKNKRLVLGAAVGGILSLTALLDLPPWGALLTTAVTSVAVAAAAFAPNTLQMLARATVGFFAAAFLLAGFFIFLLRFFTPRNTAVFGSVVYFDLSPALLFIFTCGAYVIFTLGRKLLPMASPSSGFKRFTVENAGKSVKLFAKADTGNGLREPFSGLPVIVCESTAVLGLAPAGIALLTEKDSGAVPQSVPNVRLVPFETIGGNGVLPAFKPECVTEEKSGRRLECYIAVYGNKLSAGQFNAVFNPELFDNM